MAATVTICCAHQGGLILSLPNGQSVTLSGPPAPASGLNPGYGNAGAGFTDISAEFWSTWSSNNPTSPLLVSGAVWEVT